MSLIHMLQGIAAESLVLMNKMAPYLLFGFFFAGLIHTFLSPEKIARHLGKRNFASVIKASLFGIPLPLCSCGVIPAALSLRKEGASIGAVLAFLISTPTTGVDSIFATWALMGGLFTVYRIVASFVTGVCAGILANIFIKESSVVQRAAQHAEHHKTAETPPCCRKEEGRTRAITARASEVLRYGFVDLFDDVAQWLLIGIIAGGAISFFVPAGFFGRLIGAGWLAYIIIFLIGAPMYVCATGSIPIAASMMMKGLSPGAAFVFLVSGPATNTVTIAVVAAQLGKKAAAIYLGSIFAASVTLGFALDKIWTGVRARGLEPHAMMHGAMLPSTIEYGASFLLLALIASSVYRTMRRRLK